MFDPSFAINMKRNEATPEIEYIEMPLQITVSTHKYCCICHSRKNLIVIPEEAQMQSYIKNQIYIPVFNGYP